MITMNAVLQALYDRGVVGWQVDISDDCAVIMLSHKNETLVKLYWEENALFVSHWLTDPIDLSLNPQYITMLFVALATANEQLVNGGHIGLCQMDSSIDALRFEYVAVIPLKNVDMVVELILQTQPAIMLVKGFFDYMQEKVNADVLSVDDVFTFQTGITVDIHPFLAVPSDAKKAFHSWLQSTGLTPEFLSSVFQRSDEIEIYYTLTDESISIFASNGRSNIKLDELALYLAKEQEFSQRIQQCWIRYIGLAAFLGVARSGIYANSDALVNEIMATLEC